MLTVAEEAARACVCESVVRNWITSGLLPHYRVGEAGKRGKILVEVEDLDGLMASFKVVVKKPPTPPAKPKAATAAFKHLKLS